MVRTAVATAGERPSWTGDVEAFFASLIVGLLLLGGLVPVGVPALVVAAFAVAAASAYLARSAAAAAGIAAASGLLATLLAAAFATAEVAYQPLGPASLLVTAVLGAIFAYDLRLAADKRILRESMAVALVVIVIIGSHWVATANLDRSQVVFEGKTMWQFLNERPQPHVRQVDQVYYNAIRFKLRDGTPYYQAVREAYHENTIWAADPPSVLSVREPLLPVTLAALPGDGRSVVWLMALVATAASVSALFVARNVSRLSARLAATAGVAAYFLYFTTMPFVFGFEAWGGALAVVVAACVGAAIASEDARRATRLHAIAAGIAVLAVAIRELMLFLPVAGLVAAALLPAERRRDALIVWASALVASAAVLGGHAAAASRIVTATRDASAWLSMRGGVANVVAGLRHATRFMSASETIVLIISACGIAGAFLQKERAYRAFLLISIALPFTLFLMSWNGAVDELTGKPVNYWGAIIAPLILALAPGVFGVLEGGLGRLSARLETASQPRSND